LEFRPVSKPDNSEPAERAAADPRIAALEARLTELTSQAGALAARLGDQQHLIEVRAVMDWIAQAALRSNPLVSIVLPTRNRAAYLKRAIASVEAQTYPNWELLIVDDSSVDETPSFLAGLNRKGVRCFRAEGRGVCAARNVALREARGALVAYLDDDNTMHPQWLKSVVWGFEQRPQASTLYGAFVVDDTARIDQRGGGDLPRLYFWPYDYHAVARENIADMGCIAHRAGVPEARFDESLREMGDWDLFLRLTREAPPLALPAIACFYSTDAPNRLSHGPTFAADSLAVRAKNKR
jgi:glycosyltransferase involved in cell wall biosynthesis